MPSAPGKGKQPREQQLQTLLESLLKMTRHFSGKAATIWALGAGDEADSLGGQALVATPSRPGSKRLGWRKGGQSPSSGQSPPPMAALDPHPRGRAASRGRMSPRGRVCQDSGLACAPRARFVCRHDEELIRSPASMITWGVSCLPMEAEVEGDLVLKAR